MPITPGLLVWGLDKLSEYFLYSSLLLFGPTGHIWRTICIVTLTFHFYWTLSFIHIDCLNVETDIGHWSIESGERTPISWIQYMECCFFFFSLDSSFFEPAFNISAFFSFNLLPINFLIFFFFWVYPKVTVLEMHRWACECCCLSTLLVAEWPFFFLSFLERTNCFVLKVTWQVLLSLSVFPRK